MIYFIYCTVIIIGVLAACIWFHELGHYFYFLYMLHKKVKMYVKKKGWFSFTFLVGEQEDYKGLTDEQYFKLCTWGVLAGFIPMILSLNFLVNSGLLVYVFLLYVLGSVNDIKNIVKYFKSLRGVEK